MRLAAKQAQRREFFIVGVDGSPDAADLLKSKEGLFVATCSQDADAIEQRSAVRPQLRRSEVFHGKSGSGYLTQVSIPAGRLTLLSLTQGVDGEFRLVAAERDIVEGPVLELGDTNCRVRFSCGLREFVRRWASAGPTHHGVMSTGGHLESISLLAEMFDLQLDIVSA